MSISPHKYESSTSYKTIRTPNLDVLKRQIEQFKLESRYDTKKNYRQDMSYRNVEDLERRVEIVLKQNSNLLAQNADLSELLAQRTAEIELLHERLVIQTTPSPFMAHETLIQEFEMREDKYILQIKKLLDQIQMISTEYGTLERIKRVQIQSIREECNRQTDTRISNLRRSQTSNVQIYEVQIQKLKNQLEAQKGRNDETVLLHKNQTLRYTNQIERLKSDVKNVKQLKEIELQSLRRYGQQKLNTANRQIFNIKQLHENSVNNDLRKVKRELTDKAHQNEKISNQLTHLKEQYQSQMMQIKEEKNRIRLQSQLAEEKLKEQLNRLRNSLQGMNKRQIEAISDVNKQLITSFQQEISKLYEINEYKISQIKLLRQTQNIQKDNYLLFSKALKKQNEELKNKLVEVELSHKAQTQTLKIKVAELHYSQVDHLEKYLKNEISVLSEQVIVQDKMIEDNRSKLHIELQDKDQLRKYYEVQLSKEKAKVLDLKVKLAAASVEMKQQIVSLASKMELTSQTLIREADLKKKEQTFMEEEKRKLQILINSKDRQILLLNEELNGIKKEHILEITNLEAYIRQLKTINEQSSDNTKKDKDFYESEINRKQNSYRAQIEQLKSELADVKKMEYSKVKEEIQALQKDNIRLVKQLDKEMREHQSKLQELNLQKGFVQNMQLESSAALEDQNTKYKVLVNQNQLTLKAFFEEKVALKNKEIQSLKNQLGEKQIDLRDVIVKYKDLQRKLQMALQSIDKLSDLENRVLNLGIDNNLVKNLGELFKSTRHKD